MCQNLGLDGDGNDCLGRNRQTTGRPCVWNSENQDVTIRNSNGGKYYDGAFVIEVIKVGGRGISNFFTAYTDRVPYLFSQLELLLVT